MGGALAFIHGGSYWIVSSTSGIREATCTPDREVSRVILRSGFCSFNARIAGVIINISPSESSRMHKIFLAWLQSFLSLISFCFCDDLSVPLWRKGDGFSRSRGSWNSSQDTEGSPPARPVHPPGWLREEFHAY